MDESDSTGTGNPPPPPPPAGKPKRGRVVQLPLMPTVRKVADNHLANLRSSGLSDETINLAELYTEDRPKALAELMGTRVWNRLQGAAIVIPFYSPGPEGKIHAVRLRPTHPLVEVGKNGKRRERKYVQASGTLSLVYFPPRARTNGTYGDVAAPLLWTEGEKKALALDQEGLPTIGLTGVWNWLDNAHKDRTGEERIHPMVREHVVLAGRTHVVCFDNDSREKDEVMMAAQRLAAALLAAGAARVKFVCPPEGEAKGIDDYFVAFGAQALHALIAAAEPIEPLAPRTLVAVRKCRAYQDAEALDPRLKVPDGYQLQRDGSLWRTATSARKGDERVTASPMFITRVMIDRYTAEQRVDLAWCWDGAWYALCASRKAISDSRTLVAELATYGAPVTSGTASALVDWLEAFLHANAAAIPSITSVTSTGWHVLEGGLRVFVADAVIGPTEEAPPVALDTRGDRRRMFGALAPRGDAAAHVAAIKRAWDASPLAAAAIAGALASPLLEPLKCSNFAVHLVGESSRGKTSMLKAAASVYGDPRDPQWLASWNVSPSGAELRAAALNDLPQCYDEIGAGDAQAAERMVYGLINGGGRTRATRDLGMRETSRWRTVVLSAGEKELAEEGTATGAQVRVVQLAVEGFGSLTGAEVNAVRHACEANAGNVGRQWLQELAAIEDWTDYRTALTELTAALTATAADPLQSRVAGYFALLALVEVMMQESFGIGQLGGGTMRTLFTSLGQRESVQGVAERAREGVESWVASEPDAFPELVLNTYGGLDEPKSNGVRMRHGFRRPDGTVLIIAGQFRTWCKKSRLAPRTVVREWSRLGWTDCDAGRLDKQIKIGATRARYILLAAVTSEHPTKGGANW